jgi:uncharacterized protein (TIGR02757 family)
MAKKKSVLELNDFLDSRVERYNRLDFIELDPISIPHQYKKKQDIEIAGFFAATLAWGQRVTIIKKCNELFKLMDNAPHEFLIHHTDKDLKHLENFKHRTFNSTDLLYFVEFLSFYYKEHNSLEDAFVQVKDDSTRFSVEQNLIEFHKLFFSLPYHPKRTIKHVSTPARKSACKRLNMYLRWMVRKDNKGVDFGIWKRIPVSKLICPCDVHVERVARKLKLIKSKGMNWNTAVELTENLCLLDPTDPVKYDFALFGLGVIENY